MKTRNSLIAVVGIAAALLLAGCDQQPARNENVKSTSGVSQTTVQVQTDANGHTTEQRNVMRRLDEDNKAGAVKHLYVISPDSGQILLYSTVDGKVTSSGKRLAPRTVAAQDGEYVSGEMAGIPVNIGGSTRRTTEVLEDDGTYGDSVPYIYWWDTKGIYHQHFFTGGQIIHVSSEPITSKAIVLNLEVSQTKAADQK
jgi:hypothetical protein